MRKFLFPTLFWSEQDIKQFKKSNLKQKLLIATKMSCLEFDYDLANIKTGSLSDRKYGRINFDISSIRLICFKSGVCFIDIKAQVDEQSDLIDFEKILDFNHYFRSLTPRAISRIKNKNFMHGNNINRIDDIAIFINSIIAGYEANDIEKIYYDRMFTYSYMCLDKKYWENHDDFKNFKNEFLKFQYVADSSNKSLYTITDDDMKQNTYSRWENSMFGFSRESGVVFVADNDDYNITHMPFDYEKKYLYIMLLAFYQRLCLINFSQDLVKNDKTRIKKLKKDLTRFTNFSWFSQITNSDYGMSIWKKWKAAFELEELYDEVHKEYLEYYDSVAASGQEKINIILILLYTVSVLFTGLQILTNVFNIRQAWLEILVVALMAITVLSYPVYIVLRWLKHKTEKYMI